MAKKGNDVTPPDPVVTAQAQTQSNIDTAKANQTLNMLNTSGPTGTVRYSADPTAPGGYSQVTTLSAEQQALYDQTMGIANDQLGRVNTALSTPLSTQGLPDMVSSVSGGPIASSFDKGRDLKYDIANAGQIQTSVGGDLEAARNQAQDAAFAQARSRLDPMFQTQEDQLRTKLANQGLSYNSDAYGSAADQFGRTRNDAYDQAIWSSVGAGNTAANDTFARQLSQGNFANAAQQQQYGQNANDASFWNDTSGQEYGENQGLATFANTAQQQTFQQGMANAGLANSARQQGLQERAYIQNQPISQLSALLSGSQVQTPTGIQYTPSQQANTDVLGAYALNQQAQQANANRSAQSGSAMMGGLFSLGAAAISDRRAKTNINRIGTHAETGLPLYTFHYKHDPGVQHVGVMADEVRQVRPDLVVRHPSGYDAVLYAGLGL